MFSFDSLVGFYSTSGYIAVFGVLLLCGFGLPIPEDISIIAGGIISGLDSHYNVHVMCLVSLAGVLIGDSIIYNIGRVFGERVFSKKIVGRIISQKFYERILKSFNENGKIVLFAARFMPGLRTPIFLAAGITKFVPFGTFFIIDGIAALISVPVWTYLGYYGAHNRDQLLHLIRDTKIGLVILIGVIVIIYIINRIIRKRLKKSHILISKDTDSDNAEQ